jgi:SAM-dependent methyltransferase
MVYSDALCTINTWCTPAAVERCFPVDAGKWPDEHILPMLQEVSLGYVVEIGCGTGRCSEAFAPGTYHGLDINPHAIRIAKENYPTHRFSTIPWDQEYGIADTYLFVTTLLHIYETALYDIFGRLQNRVVIYESMCRYLRNEEECCFNRDLPDYVNLLAAYGFRLVTKRVYSSGYHPFIAHLLVMEKL